VPEAAREHADGGEGQLLDELVEQLDRTRRLLTEGPEGAAEAVLQRQGRRSAEESRLVAELAEAAPLADPERFREANRLVMRALEIHDRDGWRHVRIARLGPVSPVFEYLAELVAKYVVRSYTSDVARRLNVLYARREAQARLGTPERNLLEQARTEAERVAAGYRGASFPAIVSGIAAVPVVAGLARGLGGLDWLDGTVQVILGLILFAVFGVVSYVLLQGAATARRRARLLMDGPLQALWQTLGRAGRPPEDDATTFAAIAVVLTFVGWFIVPVVVAVLVAAF
jgi:hypothetical protein